MLKESADRGRRASTIQTEVWNRPAKVERVYSDQAIVRFQDNGILDYVPLEALGVIVDA